MQTSQVEQRQTQSIHSFWRADTFPALCHCIPSSATELGPRQQDTYCLPWIPVYSIIAQQPNFLLTLSPLYNGSINKKPLIYYSSPHNLQLFCSLFFFFMSSSTWLHQLVHSHPFGLFPLNLNSDALLSILILNISFNVHACFKWNTFFPDKPTQ